MSGKWPPETGALRRGVSKGDTQEADAAPSDQDGGDTSVSDKPGQSFEADMGSDASGEDTVVGASSRRDSMEAVVARLGSCDN